MISIFTTLKFVKGLEILTLYRLLLIEPNITKHYPLTAISKFDSTNVTLRKLQMQDESYL